MKQLYFIILFFLALPLMSKAAGTATVTFDASEDRTDGLTLSKNGIAITISVNALNNMAQGSFNEYNSNTYWYLMKSGGSFTFTSSVGYITKIELTYRTGSTKNGIKKGTDGNYTESGEKAIWTRKSGALLNSVTVDAVGSNNFTSITVTYSIPDGTISISSAKYATFWNASKYTMPNGVTGYTISSVDNDITYGTTYSAGKVVPANTPLLLHGNEGTYHFYNTSSTATAAGTNLLQCSTGVEISDANTYYYKLSYRSSTDRTLGFYWDSDDGHSINISNGKAFLAVPQAIAGNAKGFDITNITNGINQLTINKNIMPAIGEIVYDASGKAHPYSTSLPRGIYFIKGVGKIAIK